VGHVHVELLTEREGCWVVIESRVYGSAGRIDVLVGQSSDHLLEIPYSLCST
jgi:hypothetical protein